MYKPILFMTKKLIKGMYYLTNKERIQKKKILIKDFPLKIKNIKQDIN